MRRWAERAALCVWIGGFAAGATMHAIDFVRFGAFPYHHGPAATNLLWNALLFLDSGAVVLLLAGWRRSGLALGAAIMVVDVAVNVWASSLTGRDGYAWQVLAQAAFLGFVLGSIAWLWPSGEASRRVRVSV